LPHVGSAGPARGFDAAPSRKLTTEAPATSTTVARMTDLAYRPSRPSQRLRTCRDDGTIGRTVDRLAVRVERLQHREGLDAGVGFEAGDGARQGTLRGPKSPGTGPIRPGSGPCPSANRQGVPGVRSSIRDWQASSITAGL
jgi:hypothetical protein